MLSPAGSKESLLSCTRTASEEAMALLEEAILRAFQQCVYYVSKVCTGCPWGRWAGCSAPLSRGIWEAGWGDMLPHLLPRGLGLSGVLVLTWLRTLSCRCQPG